MADISEETRKQARTRVLIMGAGGRDFHNFNVVYRHAPPYEVVAFTATQIPGIAGRRYPASLAGPLYPDGIPIYPEEDLQRLISDLSVDEVVFAYSDISHAALMHVASKVLAVGARFTLLGPKETMLSARVPVISVCAVRTGAGKSPISQWIAAWLKGRGHGISVIRHPMPYGDLQRQAVQRFGEYADLEAAQATIEEREEYEPYLRMGMPVYAGVDYAEIMARAQAESQVILWDGGNNDFAFLRSDLNLVVVDPLRPGHEFAYHPGEVNFRRADAYIISKANSATPEQIKTVSGNIRSVNPDAPVIMGDLEITLEDPSLIQGKKVAVVGDGPTLTHGEMGYGAGTLAARKFGAREIVNPREYLQGSLKETYDEYPHLGLEIPAMGYSPEQIRDLEATLNGIPAEVVLDATPVDLSRLVNLSTPIVAVAYSFRERKEGLTRILEQFEQGYL